MNVPSDLRVALVGGFGHAVSVFEEWAETRPQGLEFVGTAPAYAGEDLSGFTVHHWLAGFGAEVFPDVAALLHETKPQVLVISTRPDQIPVVAKTALQHGCHLILEKPIALDRGDLRKLHAQARAAGLRVMAMFTMRSIPALITARETIAAGMIGEPVLINSRKSYKWGLRPEWFNQRGLYGGTWPWVGIHNLDMAWFLTGKRVLSVTASHCNLAHPMMPHCEDVATGIFEMEGGARMTVSVDLCRPESAPSHGDERIRVVGRSGVIEVDPQANTCRLSDTAGGLRDLPVGQKPGRIFTDFLATLGANDSASDLSAFHLTDAALAARDSADSGQTVRLDVAEFW